MQAAKTVWLKKYTRLSYLPEILKKRRLHLGDPKDWTDKNDSKLIGLWSCAFDVPDIRVTCLAEAPDRFHFWDIFGECEKGVCLWFDKSILLDDIRKDTSLISEMVQYRSLAGLRQLDARLVPFAKREQYGDEREFRVIRVKPVQHIPADKFEFSALSLRRIYLNSWLSSTEAKKWRDDISGLLATEFVDVKVRQNRVLSYQPWIRAAEAALGKSP
jgi:hypothetical protein